MLFVKPHPGTAKRMTALKNQAGPAVYIGQTPVTYRDDNPPESPSSMPPKPVTRHPEFSFDNTLIAIQVESTLFNVHKYQLAKSEVFSDMFKRPKPEGDEPEEGSSSERPIVIHGVTASDFASLLKILYASHLFNQTGPESSLIAPAFRMASLFSFSELRTYLLPLEEKNLDDADKVVFAREFDIKEWLAPALLQLCKREEHLSTEEARKL